MIARFPATAALAVTAARVLGVVRMTTWAVKVVRAAPAGRVATAVLAVTMVVAREARAAMALAGPLELTPGAGPMARTGRTPRTVGRSQSAVRPGAAVLPGTAATAAPGITPVPIPVRQLQVRA